jgi:two-component system, OmpR family, sensor histidine kinase ChvG
MTAAHAWEKTGDRSARFGRCCSGRRLDPGEGLVDPALRASRDRRGLASLEPLAAGPEDHPVQPAGAAGAGGGVLFLNPFRDSLVLQREAQPW